MRIRPISTDEISAFAALTTIPEHRPSTQEYFERMLLHGVLHTELCFVAEEAGQFLGRLAYWTNPKTGIPTDLFLFDAPWQQHNQTIGSELVRQTLPIVRSLGAQHIGYVLDTPAQAPQWQSFPSQRRGLLRSLGFALVRETNRFGCDTSVVPHVITPVHLNFKSFTQVGTAVFVHAIEQVSVETRDTTIQQQRATLGSVQAAHEMLHILQGMRYEQDWWQLAYTPNDELVGLVMLTANVSSGTIGYIGVVPRQRGRGYSHELLTRGTALLQTAGVTTIYADADVTNIPMAKAFQHVGYTHIGTRQTYRLDQEK